MDKTRTTALHPQSDGMVERFNRTILNSLSHLVSSNQQDWDKKLPFFLLAYRRAVYDTTSYSPFQMLFGRDLRLPADLLFRRPPDAPLASEDYIQKLQARMEEMHHLARERIGIASEKMKTRYDARAAVHDFHEGDKVWLWNPKRRKGLSPKLQTYWEGPYTVLKRLNDVVERIQKSPHSKPKVISAAYTCLAGGTPAFCKRVFALLHAINDYIAKKLYEAPTERLQTWHQPKPVKMVPQTSEEVFMHEPAIAVENEIGFDLNVERLSEYLFPAGKLHLLSLELWVSFVSALP
ncbi:retrovirus-related Pol polyprotein from transposon 412 [Trichonephila clavipes]|nr:retrovirus-related Pol polyprotein from transposon 412 [Trichonephila clavipes]